MSIEAYFVSIKERLVTDTIIISFQIIRERTTLMDGYLRARIQLINQSRLEFSEYIQFSSTGQFQVVTYSYHWANERNQLIRRWDNTPHFPGLLGFPHHIHEGDEHTVVAGEAVSIFVVLDEIGRRL